MHAAGSDLRTFQGRLLVRAVLGAAGRCWAAGAVVALPSVVALQLQAPACTAISSHDGAELLTSGPKPAGVIVLASKGPG